jgi:hypothetical protein
VHGTFKVFAAAARCWSVASITLPCDSSTHEPCCIHEAVLKPLAAHLLVHVAVKGAPHILVLPWSCGNAVHKHTCMAAAQHSSIRSAAFQRLQAPVAHRSTGGPIAVAAQQQRAASLMRLHACPCCLYAAHSILSSTIAIAAAHSSRDQTTCSTSLSNMHVPACMPLLLMCRTGLLYGVN